MRRKAPLGARNTLEARLWARLKTLEGFRFRRRATFRTFTLDFVEHTARLVISLEDGEPGRAKAGQVVRDRLLGEAGYTILRLWRTEAARDVAGAIARIKAVLADHSAHDS